VNADQVKSVAVVGAGTMGPGMAATFARYGFKTTLFDIKPEQIEKAKGTVEFVYSTLIRGGFLTEDEAAAGRANLSYSGDLAEDSRWVRQKLDRAGWTDVKVFASGDLDETQIGALLKQGARIDAFGVGTALATPGDAPHLNLIYKLVEVERAGKVREAAKLTRAKVTYPGRKQVFRFARPTGEWKSDMIALEGESPAGGQALLVEVMRGGRRVLPATTVIEARGRCLAGLARLPDHYRQISRNAVYPVRYSSRLSALLEEFRQRVIRKPSRRPR